MKKMACLMALAAGLMQLAALADEPAAGLQAGYARVDVTPPLGIKLSGYFRVRVSDGVLDPLEAEALAISDGSRQAVLVSIDVISLRCYYQLFRQKVAEATGLPLDAVILTATHTHTGPIVFRRSRLAYGESATDFEDANDYCKELCDKVCAVSKAALADLAPAKMSEARTTAPGVSFVRRYKMKDGTTRTNPKKGDKNIVEPADRSDDTVQVVRFDREGRESIALVNFQCHPDTIGGTKISADWPGVLRRTVERSLPGVKCIFVNGAQGDTNQHQMIDLGFTQPTDRMLMHQFMGHKLAGAVLGVWDVCQPVPAGAIAFKTLQLKIPSNRPKPEEMAEARRIYDLYMKDNRSKEIPGKGMERNANIADARRKVRLEHGPDFFVAPVSVLCLGGSLAFVGFPGEPFTCYGRALKAQSPFAMTIPLCLANGHFGYLPSDAALEDSTSYESRGAIFKCGLEALMVGEAVKALNDLKTPAK